MVPAFSLALPHRLQGEELARKEGPAGRTFSLPIRRRREPSKLGRPGRRGRRDGASGSVGIGDSSDLCADLSPKRVDILLIYGV
jgi:hypothetical protein